MTAMPIALFAVPMLCCVCLAGQPEPDADAAADDEAAREAQAADEAMARRERPGVTLTLTPEVRFAGEREFDTGVGEMESVRFGADLGVGIPVEERGRLNLSLGVGVTDLDVTVAPGAAGGTNAATIASRFDEIVEVGFDAMYLHRLEEGMRLFVGGGVGFAGEGDADIDDSFVWSALGGVSFRVSEDLRLGGGVGVFSQLEDGVRVVPIPQIELRIDERWTLASERAGLKLNYAWREDLDVGVFARFEGDDYRIDDDNTLVPGGAVSDTGFPITSYLEFGGAGERANVSVRAEVGVLVGGEMEIFNAAGNTVVEEDLDTGVYAGARVRIRF